MPVARPGHRAPHVWLDDGDALFDRLGPHFTLLCIGDHPVDATPLIDAASAAGVPLEVLDLTDTIVHEVYAARLVLIRPDMMVAWRSDELPGDPAGLIDIVRGAAASSA